MKKMDCQCYWIFETFNYNTYAYKTNKTYITSKNMVGKINTFQWNN